ncbi:DUF493 family protein [Leptobacterium sp. I13]|uniref:DUF493 family protein n=1 Tax=Leptobacterium meishanense TaxID=3128904 RepID=UPI0030ED55B3
MNENNKENDFYIRLKEELANSTLWPSDYMYKFIVPTDDEKIQQIETIFDNTGAVINTKQSAKGSYTSISIVVNLKNPDAVIEKYKEVSKIEGVMSL